MRLQRPFYVDKPVESIKLRISAWNVPDSAAVLMTDFQLQAGEQPTGAVPNPREAGALAGRPQYRNGVVNNAMEIVALSNADAASPTVVGVRNAAGPARVGSYRFGNVSGSASVNGVAGTASHGWGRPPIVTERSDLSLNVDVTGRAHLRLAWEERA